MVVGHAYPGLRASAQRRHRPHPAHSPAPGRRLGDLLRGAGRRYQHHRRVLRRPAGQRSGARQPSPQKSPGLDPGPRRVRHHPCFHPLLAGPDRRVAVGQNALPAARGDRLSRLVSVQHLQFCLLGAGDPGAADRSVGPSLFPPPAARATFGRTLSAGSPADLRRPAAQSRPAVVADVFSWPPTPGCTPISSSALRPAARPPSASVWSGSSDIRTPTARGVAFSHHGSTV